MNTARASVTCPTCKLKYFADSASTCPRCAARGSSAPPPNGAAPSASSPPPRASSAPPPSSSRPPSAGPISLSSAPPGPRPPSGRPPRAVPLDAKLADETRVQLRLWNRPPADMIARLVGRGVAEHEARQFVESIVNEDRKTEAAHSRFKGGVQLGFGIVSALLGSGALIAYYAVGASIGSFAPNQFTGSLLLMGVVLFAAGIFFSARAIGWLVSGRAELED